VYWQVTEERKKMSWHCFATSCVDAPLGQCFTMFLESLNSMIFISGTGIWWEYCILLSEKFRCWVGRVQCHQCREWVTKWVQSPLTGARLIQYSTLLASLESNWRQTSRSQSLSVLRVRINTILFFLYLFWLRRGYSWLYCVLCKIDLYEESQSYVWGSG
jgi:hypothetical protein